jgi:hypothetical protein
MPIPPDSRQRFKATQAYATPLIASAVQRLQLQAVTARIELIAFIFVLPIAVGSHCRRLRIEFNSRENPNKACLRVFTV